MTDGGFCVDLESMWDDFESSVENCATMLRGDPDRMRVALVRWRTRRWTVRAVQLVPSESLFPSGCLIPASFSASASAIAPPFAR